ncbi:MAG: FAD-dependent oxidoreductase [Bacillota bacterium]
MDAHFDCIVVGAGPAGAAAALTAAKDGVNVALLERGQFPGAKNMFGGAIYSEPTREIIPAFWEEAPLERPLVNATVWFLEEDSAVMAGFCGLEFGQAPYNRFTVLRSKFDRWLAGKAVEAGAQLFTSALVTELVYQRRGLHRAVVGVKTAEGEQLGAKVVILAEGMLAPLTEQAGLRQPIPAYALAHYVQEVLALDSEKIEDRFNLPPRMGAAYGFVGSPMGGVVGKAGIWTNKDSVSITVGGYLDQMADKRIGPRTMLARFKQHPLVKKLLAGAQVLEYKAHMIPKGGYRFMPKLYADGVLVAGDAAVTISGQRGTDLAMLSGQAAGDVAALARAKEDYSAKTLAIYEHRLSNTFFMKDIKQQRQRLEYYRKNPAPDYLVSDLLNKLAYEFFKVDMTTHQEKLAKLKAIFWQEQLPWTSISDLYAGMQDWKVF